MKPGAFNSVEDALAFLDTLPIAPTLVIFSGHGVQAWWLFEEPEVFETAERREYVAGIARAFEQLVQRKAGAIGVTLDSVSDLARIMRLAGGVNVKNPRDPRLVEILRDDGPRLPGVDWLAERLGLTPVESASGGVGAVPNHLQEFSIRQCHPLDRERLEAHLEPGERLFDIWHGQKRYSHGDQSRLDQALFRELYCLDYVIEDAHPVLVEFRRVRGAYRKKAYRPDYVIGLWVKAESLGPPKAIASPSLIYARAQAAESAYQLLPKILKLPGGRTDHFVILDVLAHHMDDSGNCFMAQRQLGQLIKRHPSTANRLLRWVESHGYINLIERGRGTQASIWRLTFTKDIAPWQPS